MSADDTEQPASASDKAPAEALALRASPRPIARFRRPIIVAAVAVGAVGMAGFAWLALSPRVVRTAQHEAPSIPARGDSDALAALPKDYSQARQPVLGPPLPGDLGRAVLEQQRRDGTSHAGAVSTVSTRDQAEEAERLRLADLVRQAREAQVMVPTSGRSGQAEPLIAAALPATGTVSTALAVGGAPPSQDAKRAFLAESSPGPAGNSRSLAPPASPYQVLAGSVISAALLTGLDSDLPGVVTAQVSENVYDSVSGRFLLIPQGSRLLGAYDSKVAFGQKRVLVVWQRLTLPDGASIQLDNLPATDSAGYAGLRGTVDNHSRALLQGVAVATLLGIGPELAIDDDSEVARAVRHAVQQTSSQAGQQIVGKQLDVQPTLRVPPGSPLRILVHTDLTLRPWAAL